MESTDGPRGSTTPRDHRGANVRPWLLLVISAILVRGGILAARYDQLRADPDAYRMLAENVARLGTFGRPQPTALAEEIVPTAYRPPLYPLLLALVSPAGQLSLAATAGLHLLIGVATVVGTVWLGGALGLGRTRWLAGMLVVGDPILLNQSTLIMTETLAALLAVFVLLAAERLRARPSLGAAAVAGALAGLAALCRPTFLPWIAVLAALELCVPREPRAIVATRWDRRERVGRATALVLAAAVVLGPWAIRNQRQFDRFILTTTHGGYTLLLGNNPDFYAFLDQGHWGDVWAPQDVEAGCAATPSMPAAPRAASGPSAAGTDERESDRRLYDCAWRNIRSQPLHAARAALYRVGQLWSPWPHAVEPAESTARRVARWLAATWNTVVLAAAAAGLVRMIRGPGLRPWLPALTLCLIFTAIHLLYWSNLRMRAPLMPVVALLAASCCGNCGRNRISVQSPV